MANTKKPVVKLKVLKEGVGYTVVGQWKDRNLLACGDTWEELRWTIVQTVNRAFCDLGYTYTIEEIKFEFDLPSFFDFYKVINVKALSERIGMNQSLLSQYTNGVKKPSPRQTRRILLGVQQIGQELVKARFLH